MNTKDIEIRAKLLTNLLKPIKKVINSESLEGVHNGDDLWNKLNNSEDWGQGYDARPIEDATEYFKTIGGGNVPIGINIAIETAKEDAYDICTLDYNYLAFIHARSTSLKFLDSVSTEVNAILNKSIDEITLKYNFDAIIDSIENTKLATLEVLNNRLSRELKLCSSVLTKMLNGNGEWEPVYLESVYIPNHTKDELVLHSNKEVEINFDNLALALKLDILETVMFSLRSPKEGFE